MIKNLNSQSDRNEYIKSDTEKSIKGKQYGYRSSAIRAIKTNALKYGNDFVIKQNYCINQLDEGCFEIN